MNDFNTPITLLNWQICFICVMCLFFGGLFWEVIRRTEKTNRTTRRQG